MSSIKPEKIYNFKTKKDYEINNALDLQNYLYETNQEMLDEMVTGEELIESNKNVMESQQRARDEEIYRLAKKTVKSNKTWQHTFPLAHTWTTPSWKINDLKIIERKYETQRNRYV